MSLFKKDWLFDAKITGIALVAVLASIAVIVVMLGKFTGIMPMESAIEVYNKIYSMLALGLSFYPLLAFKAVCPQMGSDKLYMSTANLPMSRKEVFFKGLKPWFIIFPIVIIIGGLVSVVFSIGRGTFGEILFVAIFTPLLIMCSTTILQLQVIAGCIFALTKGIKGHKLVISGFIFNLALIAIGSLGIRVLKVNTARDPWWMFGFGIFIFIATLIVFIIAWRDIEKVYQ